MLGVDPPPDGAGNGRPLGARIRAGTARHRLDIGLPDGIDRGDALRDVSQVGANATARHSLSYPRPRDGREFDRDDRVAGRDRLPRCQGRACCEGGLGQVWGRSAC